MKTEDVVKRIAENSVRSIQANPGDYEKDGLLHCSVCHQPKEIMLDFGTPIKARCLCSCGIAKREREKAEAARADQEERRKGWLRGFEAFTFANDNGKNPSMAFARKYCAKWDDILSTGLSFTLSGGVGCGKTYAAAAIANEILSRGYRVWMVTASELVDMMGFETVEKAMNRLRVFELVVIDDLGAERGTEYAQQRIFDAIDTRKNSGLPTIITTNLNMDEDGDLTYRRIASRVRGFAPQYKCKGEDMRRGEGERRREELRGVLCD